MPKVTMATVIARNRGRNRLGFVGTSCSYIAGAAIRMVFVELGQMSKAVIGQLQWMVAELEGR